MKHTSAGVHVCKAQEQIVILSHCDENEAFIVVFGNAMAARALGLVYHSTVRIRLLGGLLTLFLFVVFVVLAAASAKTPLVSRRLRPDMLSSSFALLWR
jgi:hypothetical protein